MSGKIMDALIWPFNSKKEDPPKVPTTQKTTKKQDEVTEDEKKKLRQGASNSTRTLLTSPLGLADKAPVQRKTLLGE
jgi:hypothetical protein